MYTYLKGRQNTVRQYYDERMHDVMSSLLQGEVYWNANPVDAPFAAPPLLKSSDTSRMMYIWLSDYVFNTMSYNALKYNQLQYNVTNKDVSFNLKLIKIL